MAHLRTAFGLDLLCDRPLAFLADARAIPTGRMVSVSVLDGEASHPNGSGRLRSEVARADGTVLFRIEQDAQAGYRIGGPEHGVHRLSADARELTCEPRGAPCSRWERLLVSQVLPFAAALRGLEVLHASAVELDGAAIGFAASSGGGKTSLALALCELGATFLADDVLALEILDGALIAHPGTPLASISPEHDDPLDSSGSIVVDEHERMLKVAGAPAPAPLAALFFLDRRVDGPGRPRFEPASDASAILASTFNLLLTGPERLERLLEVSSLIASLRVERVAYGAGVGTPELALAVRERLAEA